MKKFWFDCGTRDAVASGGLLVLRLGFGLMMLIGHGWPKIAVFEDKKDVWPVPELWPFSLLTSPLSMMATIAAEVGAAALIALGVATRPAAFLLGFTMVVGAFQVHALDGFFLSPGVTKAKEPAILYLIPCVALIISGAGAYSVDRMIFKEKKRRFF